MTFNFAMAFYFGFILVLFALWILTWLSPFRVDVHYMGNYVSYSIFIFEKLYWTKTYNIEEMENFEFVGKLCFWNKFINMNIRIK